MECVGCGEPITDQVSLGHEAWYFNRSKIGRLVVAELAPFYMLAPLAAGEHAFRCIFAGDDSA
jgi:hypothetical protein